MFHDASSLETIRQGHANLDQQQSADHAQAHVEPGATPLTVLQHSNRLPAECRKGRECSEETDRQGNAPIGRNREVMKSKLPDYPAQEAACCLRPDRTDCCSLSRTPSPLVD